MTVFGSAYVACQHSLGGLLTPRGLVVDLGLVRDSMLAERLISLEGFLRVNDAGVHDLHVPDAWLFPDTLLIFLDELCRSLAVHEDTRERIAS